ncbi:Predicted PurR-regulated permease PerM [Halovenus aranensis]|uniref:Predicted PurR-regulated permease PerM n=1 Tax=Halovenus aranensis TaxID=890420 RepID=A0A1G8W5Q4_9EURY|nr:AI-2E family transporter [Halovenus aranensis]SDJ73065.1 Predicted PurR-regulated permease PerM [Halovenus aranensis]
MELTRELAWRGSIGLAVLILFGVLAYVGVAFLPTLVFAVFLYYAVRPIYRTFDRFGLPKPARALLSLVAFGVPFLVLIGYTAAIVVLEAQNYIADTDILEGVQNDVEADLRIGSFDLSSLEESLADVTALPSLDVVANLLFEVTSTVSGLFLQLILIVIAVYYMLVDGGRIREWFLETYDRDRVLRTYLTEVDTELSSTLFGNIANIFVTGIIAIVSFLGYNLLVPDVVTVPFPALAGTLIGVGTLIPVIGIKLVYVPLVGGLAVNAWLAGEPTLVWPVGVLFVYSAIVLDFIPDLFIRAQFSGEATHSGLLMIAYVVGPVLFGFYGLFLMPILLILAINAVTILLPYVLSGDSEAATQTELSRFQ